MLAEQICETFNRCFVQSHTKLVGGASEPLYEPGKQEARVYFREDYASSALHEIAHWCIAGADRRPVACNLIMVIGTATRET